MKYVSIPAILAFISTPLLAGPFTEIRIGDVDGFGYGAATGFKAANGGPANINAGGPLETLDFLPDINENGSVATGSRDDFDLRSAAEIAGGFLTGSGYSDSGGTTGSQFTDIALSTSYDSSSSSSNVLIGGSPPGLIKGAGGPFPMPPSGSLTNQPGFEFDFFVEGTDIISGTTIYFNLVFGDYDVFPATVQISNGSTLVLPLTLQGGGNDGLIQAAFVPLDFNTVFTPEGTGYRGHLNVDFIANNEPYTAFDFVELSVDQIPINPTIPEPSTLLLLGIGLGALGYSRRGRARRKTNSE
jgi:hypothetical protein